MHIFRLAYESDLILNIIDNSLLAYRIEKPSSFITFYELCDIYSKKI